MIWDNASPHKSELMRELFDRLGCKVRFSTPYHPENHFPAERLIGSIKSLVSKVAAEHPKRWHLFLDFVLWALRESDIESLGASPWTLFFFKTAKRSIKCAQRKLGRDLQIAC